MKDRGIGGYSKDQAIETDATSMRDFDPRTKIRFEMM